MRSLWRRMISSNIWTSPASTRSITWASVQGSQSLRCAESGIVGSSPGKRKGSRSGRLARIHGRGVGGELAEFLDQPGAERQRGALVGVETIERQIRAAVSREATHLLQYIQ